MRIHADNLTSQDVFDAARFAKVTVTVSHHGSRKRNRAFEVRLEGSSSRSTQDNLGQAATWDEWGDFLGFLFRADATTTTQPYESPDHFTWTLGDRFNGEEYDHHKQHKWNHDVNAGTCVTGAYHVTSCKCGAIMRRMSNGRSFEELSD